MVGAVINGWDAGASCDGSEGGAPMAVDNMLDFSGPERPQNFARLLGFFCRNMLITETC